MKIQHFIILSALLLFAACKRDEPTRWGTEVFGPIAHGSFSISDFVADSLIETDEDGIVHLSIQKSIIGLDIDSLIAAPDTTISKAFNPGFIGGPFAIPPGVTFIDLEEENNFAVGNTEMRNVHFKGGIVEYEMRNYVNGPLQTIFTLPGVVLNDEPFVIDQLVGGGSPNNPGVATGIIDMTGYQMDLTGGLGVGFNKLVSITEVKVDPDATADVDIYGTDSVIIDITFIDPAIEYARGYFGTHETVIQDTVRIEVMDDLNADLFLLDQVDMSIDLQNFMGVDAQLKLNEVIAKKQDNIVALEHPELFNWINVTRAQDNLGNVTPSVYSYSIDEENSNIVPWIGVLPNEVIIDAQLNVNPLGDVSGGNDFIYTDQPIDLFTNIDIPMCLSASNMVLSKTIDINRDLDQQVAGFLYLRADNSFPFEGIVDLEIIDVTGDVLSTLPVEGQIVSGVFNSTTGNTAPVKSTMVITIPEDAWSLITTENRFRFNITMNSYASPEMIKLKEANHLEVQIVGDINYEVQID